VLLQCVVAVCCCYNAECFPGLWNSHVTHTQMSCRVLLCAAVYATVLHRVAMCNVDVESSNNVTRVHARVHTCTCHTQHMSTPHFTQAHIYTCYHHTCTHQHIYIHVHTHTTHVPAMPHIAFPCVAPHVHICYTSVCHSFTPYS